MERNALSKANFETALSIKSVRKIEIVAKIVQKILTVWDSEMKFDKSAFRFYKLGSDCEVLVKTYCKLFYETANEEIGIFYHNTGPLYTDCTSSDFSVSRHMLHKTILASTYLPGTLSVTGYRLKTP